MITTVFRSRLEESAIEQYEGLASHMANSAMGMPGLVALKSFVADDWERCTIVEFESEETHRAWAEQPEHCAAQRRGIEEFDITYDLKVAEMVRTLSK